MKKTLSFFCALTLCVMSMPAVDACTSIRVKTTDGYVFSARTMEGEVSFRSTVSIIPAGTQYLGTLPDGTQKGLKWTTKYGIVGMNTFGLPIISDGLNEKGLSAGNLLFPGYAKYQSFDATKTESTIAQWEVVTWILSNFTTVAEVREGLKQIRICEGPQDKIGVLQLHYVVYDAAGNSIVIEHVDGQLKVYDNLVGAFTNSPPFDWHLTNLRNYINLSPMNTKAFQINGLAEEGIGQGTGMLGLPGDYTPPSRFIKMAALVNSALPVTGADAGLDLAMTIINNVDIPKGTVRDEMKSTEPKYDSTDWVVICDLGRQGFYFRTYENKNWRYVDMVKALGKAKTIMSLPIKTPPTYQDVTAEAKNYQIPAEYFPTGTP